MCAIFQTTGYKMMNNQKIVYSRLNDKHMYTFRDANECERCKGASDARYCETCFDDLKN